MLSCIEQSTPPASMQVTGLQVIVRVRPLSFKEMEEGSKENLLILKDQVTLKTNLNKAYIFDSVLPPTSTQEEVFLKCTNLLLNFLEGFNATILAYGQTGSGKTHTMGSGFTLSDDKENFGVIQRSVRFIFEELENKRNHAKIQSECLPEFSLRVSFLELYNETIIDLLGKPNSKSVLSVQEKNGIIHVAGLQELPVSSQQEIFDFLRTGSLSRSTGSTNMNQLSSRSHAIFTLILDQRIFCEDGSDKFLKSKFHFVDLAGSERLKKTQAIGERAKEGISINCGLLALGNVISVLGDPERKLHHVNYRDSKLTRLLQDSLGGNSRTLMIACISAAESSEAETKNTLNYAVRARNIKNKAVINYDSNADILTKMKQEIMNLRSELAKAKEQSVIASSLGGVHGGNIEKFITENNRVRAQNREFSNIISSFISASNSFQNIIDTEDFKDCREPIRQGIINLLQITKEHTSKKPLMSHSHYNELAMHSDSPVREANLENNFNEEPKATPSLLEMVEHIDFEISSKEGLILNIQSELQSQEIEEHRNVYVNKIQSMELIIKETEKQRDLLLKNIQSLKNKENALLNTKVLEYEKNISESKQEITRLQRKTNQLTQRLKDNQSKEKKIAELLQEVREMKRQKIRLLKQMKEDSNRNNTQKELQKRTIAKLEKERGKDKARIATLEVQNKLQTEVLKRKLKEANLIHKRRKLYATGTEDNIKRETFDRPIDELQTYLTNQIEALVIQKQQLADLSILAEKKSQLERDLSSEINEEEREYLNAEVEYINIQLHALENCNEILNTTNISDSIQEVLQSLTIKEASAILKIVFLEEVPFLRLSLDAEKKIVDELKRELAHSIKLVNIENEKVFSLKSALKNAEETVLLLKEKLSNSEKLSKDFEVKNDELERSQLSLIQEIKRLERIHIKKELQLRQQLERNNIQANFILEQNNRNVNNKAEPSPHIVQNKESELTNFVEIGPTHVNIKRRSSRHRRTKNNTANDFWNL